MRRVTLDTIVRSNLRQRRSQNRVLVIGVSLAVFFLAVCVFAASCLLASYERGRRDREGEADFRFLNTGGVDIAALFPRGFEVELTEQELLFASMGDAGSDDDFAVARYDEGAIALLHARLTEGRWPERPGEIAVEGAALWRMRLRAGVGDAVTLTLAGWDGEAMQASTEERSFVITGILANQAFLDSHSFDEPLAPNVASAWVSEGEPLIAGSRAVRNTYVRALGWRSRLALLRDDLGPWWNSFENRWSAELGRASRVHRLQSGLPDFVRMNTGALLGIGLALLALVGAAMAGIGAAVSANADKRRAQVGMLRAIGATQTQVRRILRRETLGVALATLPPGIGGAWLLLWGIRRLHSGFVLRVPPALVFVVAGLSVLFLAAATARPIRRAANVSPMQALRDVEMLRRQRETRAGSRRRFRPPRLLAARNMRFHRGRMAGIVALIVSGTLLVSVAFSVGAQMVGAYGARLDRSYGVWLNWMRFSEADFGNWEFGERLLTLADKRDLEAVPMVERVSSVQSGRVAILLDELSPYITGDGWDPTMTYFFADGPAYAHYLRSAGSDEFDEALSGEWPEHGRYRRFREQYGIDRQFVGAELTAVDEASLAQGEWDVYDGAIHIDAINAGREVIVVAPRAYFEQMDFELADGSLRSYGSSKPSVDFPWAEKSMREGMPEEKIVRENDTFFAGEAVDLCWIMSWDAGADPARSVRVDASPTIGAVVAHSAFPKGGGPFGIITTEQGLAAMGMDAGYDEFGIYLAGDPDEALREEITREIEAVAARVDGVQVIDWHEAAMADRAMYRSVFAAVSVAVVLLFAFTTALINSSVSGRIRADERQIGTMRAVGADRRVIAASYTRQLWNLVLTGGGLGWGGYIAWRLSSPLLSYSGWPGGRALLAALLQWQSLAPALFLVAVFCVCALSVRARLRPIFQKPVVENIRIL